MRDLEVRVAKLEKQNGGGCSLLAMIAFIVFVLGWWASRWELGKTDMKPPFYVERVSYEEWKARP